ncbi:MAG: hypothetical protein BRD40_04690 [Bacteroidetes bacterium QS_1_65_9]|nr:MAG: hypothetical protein BRD40_04690 [Bacteroidetes bacterium QS_1_65_9]
MFGAPLPSPLERIVSRAGRLGLALAVAAVWGLLAAAAPAQAQTIDDALRYTQRAPAAGDARSMALSGAGRAGLGDAAPALYLNPAGLGWMSSSSASGAFALIGAQDEARFRAGTFDPTGPQSSDVSDYGGHLTLAYEVPTTRGALVFAGGYRQVNTFGRNFTYAAYQGGAIAFYGGDYPYRQAVTPGTTIEQIGEVTEEGRLSELNLGAGVAAAENVMLGLSFNTASGTYRNDQFFEEADLNDQNRPSAYSVILQGETAAEDDTLRGFDGLINESRFESDLSGVNLRGGLSAKALPGLRLGLTLETPTFYQVSEQYTEADVTTFFDDDNQLRYGDQSEDVGVGEIEYEVLTPFRLGAGFRFNTLALTGGVADLSLIGDVEVVDWRQLRLDADQFDFSDENEIGDENFQPVFNTNLGAELHAAGASLRAGFAYRPDPQKGEFTLADGEASNSDRTFFSAGLGYTFANNVRVDLSWMQERFDDQFRPYPSVEVPDSGTQITAPSVSQEIVRNRFLVGVTYSF